MTLNEKLLKFADFTYDGEFWNSPSGGYEGMYYLEPDLAGSDEG